MKLWLLTRLDSVGWDEYDEKVVIAPTEIEARVIANQETGDEGLIWTDSKIVKCEEVLLEGEPRELLGSFRAG